MELCHEKCSTFSNHSSVWWQYLSMIHGEISAVDVICWCD